MSTDATVSNEEASAEAESEQEAHKDPAKLVDYWLKEIGLQRKSQAYTKFLKQGELATQCYLNDVASPGASSAGDQKKSWYAPFNIYWSTIQTLMPTYFARVPKPMCERRLKTSNPIPLLASQITERCVSFQLSIRERKFKATVQDCIQDMLIPGMGIMWKGWECEFDKTGEVIPGTEILKDDFVFWKDFGWKCARNWAEVRAIWRRLEFTRQECIDMFGEEIGKKISLGKHREGLDKNEADDESRESFKRAGIWQICDKDDKKVYWISEGYKAGPLKILDDPWGLKGFYPVPCPLRSTTSTEDFTPVSLFTITQWILDEIAGSVRRLGELKSCVKYVGAHDPQFNQDIQRIQSQENGVSVPAKSWPELSQKGGLTGVQSWQDISNLVPAINQMIEYVAQLLQWYWEITGIPDIVRGSSDPNETAKAQQYKGNWTIVRTSQKQQEVQDFCAESCAMDAEFIFQFFSDDCIRSMSGFDEMTPEQQANFPAALEILRSDILREYKIFIETDSTLKLDQEAQQAARTALLESVGNFMSQAAQMLQMFPDSAPATFETVMFAIRGIPNSDAVEGAWENFVQEFEAKLEQQKQQPPEQPPDPQMIAAQATMMDAQTRQRAQELAEFIRPKELELEGQTQQLKADIEYQKLGMQGMKAQADAQAKMMQAEGDQAKAATDAQVQAVRVQNEGIAEMFQQFIERQRLELEKFDVVTSQREHMLEERRLAQENQIEAAKVQNHRLKIVADLKKTNNAPIG